MSPEGLQIRMGADVSRAIAGLKQVETAMQKTVSNSKAFEASVGKSGQALGKIVNPSNQATLALTNLGRVAQDAPFGFLGIANNLNPLLESFQRLKATTGSTGGALKALGKSLTGAGGLGIALSVVSSAVLFAQMGFSLWTKKTKEAKEETDQLAESVAKSLVTLTSLVGIVQNVNSSNEDRVKALKAINEQYAKYIPNLEKEGITANNIALAYDTITEALLRQAVVKGLQAEIQKEVEATAGKIIKLTKEQERLRLESDKSVKPVYEKIAADKILQRGQEGLTKATTDGFIAQQKQSQATKAQIGSTNVLGQVINKLKEDLKETLKPLLNLTTSFDDLDVSIKEVKVKPNKVTIDKAKFTDFSQLGFSIIPPDEFKPVATSAATLFSKEFGEYFKKPGVIDFSLIQAVNDEKLNKEAKNLAKDLGTNFSQSFRDAINSGVSSIGEGIGNVLSGQDFGSSITDAFSGLLSSLGKALIEYGIIKEGLDKILGPGGIAIPGAIAIGLGVLAIAASTALKNIGGARASGGPVAGNTPYLVGERGPEIFTPSVSGSIIPNNQIGSFSGRSQMATVRVTGRLRGNDMILQNARTNRMQTRLG